MELTQTFTKEDGTPFGNKGALVSFLSKKEVSDKYEPEETASGGWIGVLRETPATKKKPELIKCRVYRSNVDPDNRDMPISVTFNSIANKRVFWPGAEVELMQGHINILKDSVEEVRLEIPAESGIYASRDPISVAKGFYPNMRAEINPADNMITMVSRTPNYIIETIE